MNEKKSARLRIFILLCLGSLLVAGFIQASGMSSLSQLRQSPLSLKVPVIQQSLGTSCGEAVIVMTYNYAYPETPLTEEEVIDYAAAQGYFTEDLAPFTSPANMVEIAEHYADDVSSGTVVNADQALAFLLRKLRHGEPVNIDVLSNFRDPESEAHFVVITGISMDPNNGNAIMIHYNDPLTGTSQVDEWAGSEGVWNAWKNNGDPGGPGWWMVISPP